MPAVELGAASAGFGSTYAATGDFDKALMVANFSALGAGALASRHKWFKCFVNGSPLWVPEHTYSKLAYNQQNKIADSVTPVSSELLSGKPGQSTAANSYSSTFVMIGLAIASGLAVFTSLRNSRKTQLGQLEGASVAI